MMLFYFSNYDEEDTVEGAMPAVEVTRESQEKGSVP